MDGLRNHPRAHVPLMPGGTFEEGTLPMASNGQTKLFEKTFSSYRKEQQPARSYSGFFRRAEAPPSLSSTTLV
jgi:hypothetical protein